MKKILFKFFVFLSVVAVIVILFVTFGSDEGARYVHKGNHTHEPVEIDSAEYQCSECSMDIEALPYSAQLVTNEGDTYFFDDIGCLVLWLQNHTVTIKKIFTQTLDTHQWISVDKAWYTRKASSPMGYGFAAYENRLEGFVTYEEMRLMMLQGKHLHDPFVKKSLKE